MKKLMEKFVGPYKIYQRMWWSWNY